MERILISLLFCIALFSASPRGEQQPPRTLAIGNASVSMVTQARRAHLLGAVDLYDVAIYLPDHVSLRLALLDSDVPKALRIRVHAPDDLPQRLTLDWRSELIPRLNPAATTHLRNACGSLRSGDLFLVEYSPQLGTTVRINKTVAVPSATHDLMLAFVDHWLGQRPVSEEMKRQLLGPS